MSRGIYSCKYHAFEVGKKLSRHQPFSKWGRNSVILENMKKGKKREGREGERREGMEGEEEKAEYRREGEEVKGMGRRKGRGRKGEGRKGKKKEGEEEGN